MSDQAPGSSDNDIEQQRGYRERQRKGRGTNLSSSSLHRNVIYQSPFTVKLRPPTMTVATTSSRPRIRDTNASLSSRHRKFFDATALSASTFCASLTSSAVVDIYNLCATCIERVEKDFKPYPLCNEPGYTTTDNKGLKRDLNEFRIYCPHRGLRIRPLWAALELVACNLVSTDALLAVEALDRSRQTNNRSVGVRAAAESSNARPVFPSSPSLSQPRTCEYCREYRSTFETCSTTTGQSANTSIF